MGHNEQTSDLFAWPPTESSPHLPKTAAAPIQIRLPHPLVESIETQLLGRTGLAFDLWVQQTGWTRDDTDVYCWRCGGSIGQHESDGEGCADCRTKKLPWTRAIRLGKHHEILRQEVLALKFAKWRPTGEGLGMHLGHAIRQQLDLAQISPDQAKLVPIPMHRFRRIARGVDHTMVLAKAAAKSSGTDLLPVLSSRWRQEQVGLSKTARAKNMKDAFFFSRSANRIMKKQLAQEQRVLVFIDDVRTTGATFVAASKSLKSALLSTEGPYSSNQPPIEIWIASISVARESRRKEAD